MPTLMLSYLNKKETSSFTDWPWLTPGVWFNSKKLAPTRTKYIWWWTTGWWRQFPVRTTVWCRFSTKFLTSLDPPRWPWTTTTSRSSKLNSTVELSPNNSSVILFLCTCRMSEFLTLKLKSHVLMLIILEPCSHKSNKTQELREIMTSLTSKLSWMWWW